MSEVSYVTQAGIFFSCLEKKQSVLEQIIPEHILTHVYEGKASVTTADKTYILSAGQTALFSRNQLARFKKEPDGQVPYRAATIFFTKSFLQQFYAALPLPKQKAASAKVLEIENHALLDNLFQSISLYSNTVIPDDLALLKIKEAITVIRMFNKDADTLLSDFSEPHKIDLSDFLNKNFMFNISISRFAYLTGRSLATFKRDFKKTFDNSPQKWLTEKRLRLAHFLIAEKNRKPSQAYLEAGFESFSHFTYAFKKFFGYNPSSVLSR